MRHQLLAYETPCHQIPLSSIRRSYILTLGQASLLSKGTRDTPATTRPARGNRSSDPRKLKSLMTLSSVTSSKTAGRFWDKRLGLGDDSLPETYKVSSVPASGGQDCEGRSSRTSSPNDSGLLGLGLKLASTGLLFRFRSAHVGTVQGTVQGTVSRE